MTGLPCSASQVDRSLPPLSGSRIKCEDIVHEMTVHVQHNHPRGEIPTLTLKIDMNDLHCSFGHFQKELIIEMAKQLGVTLTGALVRCMLEGAGTREADAKANTN